MGISAVVFRALSLMGFALLCLWAQCAAATDNGFAAYLGPVSSSDSAVYGSSHGLAIGVDAQFVVNDEWSLNPYLVLSSESTNQTYHLTNGEGGLQARYWLGSWFMGGQFLFHDLLLTKNGSVSTSIYSPAFGLAAGWEGSNHWSLVLEANALEKGTTLSTTGNNRSDVLLLVGYRWY